MAEKLSCVVIHSILPCVFSAEDRPNCDDDS